MLARLFVADTIADLVARLVGREALWGVDAADLDTTLPFLEAHRSPAFLEEVAGAPRAARAAAPRTSPTSSSSSARRSTASPPTRSGPSPSTCTATNADVPE